LYEINKKQKKLICLGLVWFCSDEDGIVGGFMMVIGGGWEWCVLLWRWLGKRVVFLHEEWKLDYYTL